MEKKHGGKRSNAGRKSKVDEEKVNNIMLSALAQFHNVEGDTEAKKAFAVDLLSFERGKMFIAEHIFGKPKEIIENINHNIEHDLTEDTIKLINKEFENKY
mgnify:FL=1